MIAAVIAGIAVGLLAPEVGKALKPLGTGFVSLIKMMISPVIFCTIVLGIGSIRQAAKVGKVGGLALLYFIVMSTVALIIGLVVGNLLQPGAGLQLTDAARAAGEKAAGGEPQTTDRVPARHHPDHAGLPAGRRARAADAVRGAVHRLRRAGSRPVGSGDPAWRQALRAAGVPGPVDDHVGGSRSARSAPSPPWSARPAGPRWSRLGQIMLGLLHHLRALHRGRARPDPALR